MYVPAGWWHQVSSEETSGARSKESLQEPPGAYVASVNAFAPDTGTPWHVQASWHLVRLRLGNFVLRIQESMTHEVPTVILPPLR